VVKRRNGLADRGTSTGAFAQVSALSSVDGWFSSLNAFSRRLLTAEARVRYQVSRREICVGQCGTGTGFSQNTSVFSCQYHSTNAPYSSSSTRCYYRTDKWAKLGIFQKQCSYGSRAAVDRKVFSLFLVFEGLTSMFYNFRAWRPRGGRSFILPQLGMFGSCRNSLVSLSFHVSLSWTI